MTAAARAIREGRVRVLPHNPASGFDVQARVTSSRSRRQYVVDMREGRWFCTCTRDGCHHTTAVRMVTDPARRDTA
jgi:hypothetical protein